VPIGLVAAVVLLRRVELLALGAWIVVSALFLVAQQPLLDHHFVLLAAALAVPAGAGLGAAVSRVHIPVRYAVVGVIALAIAVGFVQEERRLWRQEGDPPAVVDAAEFVGESEPDTVVVTDLPIVAYLADRRVPGHLVDTSFVRFGTGSLTDVDIIETLSERDIRVVVVGRQFAERPRLMRALRERYGTSVHLNGSTVFLAP
jgi:hypothetical protein